MNCLSSDQTLHTAQVVGDQSGDTAQSRHRHQSADAAGAQVDRHRRTDDAARRRAFPEDRDTRGSDLGAGAVRGALSQSHPVHRAL